MQEELKVVLIQTSIFWEETGKNLDHFEKLLKKITGSVDLILLPEMFNTGFTVNTDKCAEPMDGLSVKFLVNKAAEMNAAIMGTLILREGGNCFNRLVCAYPDGRIATYDKRHLFRLVEEYRLLKGGTSKIIVDIKGWKILPIICYDLRFPVWSKNTFNNDEFEYDLMVCCANWPRSRAHIWKTLLAARAIENQAYSAGVNRVGEDGNGTFHSGDSLVSDAKGQIVAAAKPGHEEVLQVTLSGKDLRLYREAFTVGMDWDRFVIEN